jgi:hypothetical protein
MASNDPAFEEKAVDIIGLYLDPPQHAAISASVKRPPCGPWIASIQRRPRRRGAPSVMDSSTTGTATLSLYAALDVKTGEVHG